MKMRLVFIIALFIRATLIFSQNCSCEENLRWLVMSFETNDVDFSMLKEQIGEEDYNNQINRLVKSAKKTTDKNECFDILNQYLKFLRPENKFVNEIKITINNNHYSFRDTIIEFKLEDFNSDTMNMSSPCYEGVWETYGYKIGIKKIHKEYIGFIIDCNFETWKKGQVKFIIKKGEFGNFTVLYANRFHYFKEMDNVELIGKNYLRFDDIFFKRVLPSFENKDLDELDYCNSISADYPFFENLSENTNYFRIASNPKNEIREIDNKLTRNYCFPYDNLILDLRENNNSYYYSYQKILNAIYVDTIIQYGEKIMCSQENINYFQRKTLLKELSDDHKEMLLGLIEKMKVNIGDFLYINNSLILDSIFKKEKHENDINPIVNRNGAYPKKENDLSAFSPYGNRKWIYPKKVGIIIDDKIGNETEQFLLLAKQSDKVIIFGLSSNGPLDLSDINQLTSPCGDFKFNYYITRKQNLPKEIFRDNVIKPDNYIDEAIPKHKWKKYVMNKMESDY